MVFVCAGDHVNKGLIEHSIKEHATHAHGSVNVFWMMTASAAKATDSLVFFANNDDGEAYRLRDASKCKMQQLVTVTCAC